MSKQIFDEIYVSVIKSCVSIVISFCPINRNNEFSLFYGRIKFASRLPFQTIVSQGNGVMAFVQQKFLQSFGSRKKRMVNI